MVQNIKIKGTEYVIIPKSEYRRLTAGKDTMPRLPKADRKGDRPARETIMVMIAQDLIAARKKAKMTQAELAEAAGVRLETISRLENARHVPSARTMAKIDKVLGTDL